MTWQEVCADRRWDEWLTGFRDSHVKQTAAWSRWKAGAWESLPSVLLNGQTPLAMALCLVRRAPLGAATVLWVNGGPVFRKQDPEDQDLAALSKFLEGLKERAAGFRRPMVRLNLAEPADPGAQLLLRQAGFQRPLVRLDTGLTYVVELTRSLDELHAGLERKWRNQLRQAEKAGPQIAFGRDRGLLRRYLPLHNELVGRKRLDGQKLTLEELERMVEALGDLITFMIVSAQGQDGCGGALWTFGGKGSLAMSAANETGLKKNLPNFMFWRAIEHLKAAGCVEFDLMGVDPKANWGVFNFKRGLGARAVEMLGEWEWSPSDWTRRAFNLALAAGRGAFA